MAALIPGIEVCALFPTSRDPNDLAEPFKSRWLKFAAALIAGGCVVTYNATYRPEERAYLMHWAWMIAREGYASGDVPPHANVDINWDVPNAKFLCEQMVETYKIAYQPALISRHTQRFAVDVNITWKGDLNVVDANGMRHNVNTQPRDTTNSVLVEIGRTFGVIKNHADRPHWSIDGR